MGEVGTGFPLQRIIRIALVAVAVLVASTRPSIAFSKTGSLPLVIFMATMMPGLRSRAPRVLSNSNGHWAAGKTTLVQLGDVLDREPELAKNCSKPAATSNRGTAIGRPCRRRSRQSRGNEPSGRFSVHNAWRVRRFSDPRSPERRDRYYASIERTVEAAAHAQNPAVFPPKFASNGWLIIHLAGSNMQEHGARRARSDDGRLTILP